MNGSTDLIALIFSFLNWKEVLKARRVCRQWREAAKFARIEGLLVNKRSIGRNLGKISMVLPRIEEVQFDFTKRSEKFLIQEGGNVEKGDKRLTLSFLSSTPLKLEKELENFRYLHCLVLKKIGLHGSYPFLFEKFEQLEQLDVSFNGLLQWDLKDLSGLPHLRRLICRYNHKLTGDTASLKILYSTLVELNLYSCGQVTGSLQDICTFPVLEELEVDGTAITGDIRAIGPHDFPSLHKLHLGKSIYGGVDVPTIQDAPSIMKAKYVLMKRIPDVFEPFKRWHLANDSSDRYAYSPSTAIPLHSRAPPFYVEFVKAGSRIGWRWTNCTSGGACETRWLDPEPDSLCSATEDDEDNETYRQYKKDLENIQRDVEFYYDFYDPPSQLEHIQRNNECPLDPILMISMNRLAMPW